MADGLPPKGPDNYQNHQEKPAIIKTAESLGVGPKTGKAIFDTKKGVATVLVAVETKKETTELNETFKKSFIEKLKKLPDYEGSKVQEAIEKGTIEIKRIPNRDVYAIYESKIGNLVYITDLEGKKYFNLDRVRNGPLRGGLEVGYRKLSGVNEKIENGLYNLYRGDKKINILSDEYLGIVLKSIDMMLNFKNDLKKEIERKEKEGID